MKSLIVAAALVASVLTGIAGASAADRFDGARFFEEQTNRAASQ